MASDEDYVAFLDKANKDPSEGYAKPQTAAAAAGSEGGNKQFRATEEGVKIPKPLRAVTRKGDEVFYTSDADEPFEAVALKWDEAGKGLPDEGEFSSTLLSLSCLALSGMGGSPLRLVLWFVGPPPSVGVL